MAMKSHPLSYMIIYWKACNESEAMSYLFYRVATNFIILGLAQKVFLPPFNFKMAPSLNRHCGGAFLQQK